MKKKRTKLSSCNTNDRVCPINRKFRSIGSIGRALKSSFAFKTKSLQLFYRFFSTFNPSIIRSICERSIILRFRITRGIIARIVGCLLLWNLSICEHVRRWWRWSLRTRERKRGRLRSSYPFDFTFSPPISYIDRYISGTNSVVRSSARPPTIVRSWSITRRDWTFCTL